MSQHPNSGSVSFFFACALLGLFTSCGLASRRSIAFIAVCRGHGVTIVTRVTLVNAFL